VEENHPPLLTALQAAAIELHELFLNLCNAGFSEDQAMRIVTSIACRNAEDD
jgi:hypothetical protein